MRKTLSEAKSQGKHQILMRVKIGDATRFMGLKLPPTRVDIAAIRRKYDAAEREEKGQTKGAKRDREKSDRDIPDNS